MTKEELINECLKMPGSYLDYPFGPTTAVLKTAKGKMFAFLDYAKPQSIKKSCGADAPVSDGDIFINLKCERALIDIFRAQYKAVLPGYYDSSKIHWNTVIVDKDVPTNELIKMIQHSFEMVTKTKLNKDKSE